LDDKKSSESATKASREITPEKKFYHKECKRQSQGLRSIGGGLIENNPLLLLPYILDGGQRRVGGRPERRW
jgi:hypothetical protein